MDKVPGGPRPWWKAQGAGPFLGLSPACERCRGRGAPGQGPGRHGQRSPWLAARGVGGPKARLFSSSQTGQVEGLQGPVNPALLGLAAPSWMTLVTGQPLGMSFLLLVAVLGSVTTHLRDCHLPSPAGPTDVEDADPCFEDHSDSRQSVQVQVCESLTLILFSTRRRTWSNRVRRVATWPPHVRL